jgi:hypothetical protein
MQINLNDPTQILSHVLLHDTELSMAVAATPGFVEGKQIVPAVTFNGVAVDAEIFEAALKQLYNQLLTQLAARYADVEQEVQRRLEQRMKDEASQILEKMHQLESALADAAQLIKPYWEK